MSSIIIKEFPGTEFANKQEMFTALRKNKAKLISFKKATMKEGIAVMVHAIPYTSKGERVYHDRIKTLSKGITKSIYSIGVKDELGNIVKQEVDASQINSITAKLAINTMNILDSHDDVHLKGTFRKSVKESRSLMLLQEHTMAFKSIITDKVVASLPMMTWKELGELYKGETEVLLFDVTIDKDRNAYMFGEYLKGHVKNHSVGMSYVEIKLAMNSESKHDEIEKAEWDKHIDKVVNKAAAEAQGFVWFVYEAKVHEGSAVPVGSNTSTPTINIEAVKEDTSTIEPNEPPAGTQTGLANFYKRLIK